MSKVKKAFLHNFKREIMDSGIPCMVKFYSDTCYLCDGLSPIFDDLAKAFQGKVNFYKVNVRVEKRLSNMFSGDGVPTVYYFKNGKGYELDWPEEPEPMSGYTFLDLSRYLHEKLKEND